MGSKTEKKTKSKSGGGKDGKKETITTMVTVTNSERKIQPESWDNWEMECSYIDDSEKNE